MKDVLCPIQYVQYGCRDTEVGKRAGILEPGVASLCSVLTVLNRMRSGFEPTDRVGWG